MITPRNPQQDFTNATMLDAVLLEISIELKKKLTWLDSCYTAAQKLQNTQDSKKINYPAVFTGGTEYLNLLPDGHLGNYSFFRMNDPEEIEYYARNVNKITAEFDLIIWFNLKKVYPIDTGRNIEHVKSEVLKAFREITITRGTYQLEQIYKDAKNIFSTYSIDETQEQFMMHPYGALMIRGKLIYKEDC
jgi:hypothetical protein